MIRRQPPKLQGSMAPLETWLLGLNRDLESVPNRVDPPASSTATGVVNTFAYDANFFYVCYATDSWARIAWTDVVF